MENKKTVLIIILAAILAFLTASLVFKSSNKPIKLKNAVKNVEIEKPTFQETQKTEEIIKSNEEANSKINTEPTKVNKPIPKPVVKVEEPTIVPIQVEAEDETPKTEEVISKQETTEPYQEGNNIVVIPQEYKIKSPAKYSFK